MKLNAWCVFAAWIALFLLIALFVAVLSGFDADASLLVSLIVVLVFLLLCHMALALYLVCPNCGKRPTIQGFQTPHAKTKKMAGLDGWAVVVVSVITKHQFKCIHCGESYSVEPTT